MEKTLLDLRKVCVFSKDSASVEKTEDLYPSVKCDCLFVKMKGRNNYICFVFKKAPEESVVSTTLYALNHFKGKKGTVCVRTESFTEYVEIVNGRLEKSICCESADDERKADVVFCQKDVLRYAGKKDMILKESTGDKKEKAVKKALLIFLIVFSVTCLLYFRHIKNLEAEKAEEFQKREIENQEKALKEKESEVLKLKEEYENLFRDKTLSVYECLCALSSALGRNSFIEEVNIEKDDFNLLVKTKNGVKVFENLEKSPHLKAVTMTKTVSEGNFEKVGFNGKSVRKKEILPDESEAVERQLEFYSKKLKEEKALEEKKAKLSYSDYAGKIRTALRKTGLSEEYMSFKEGRGDVLLEVFLRADIVKILTFLENTEADEVLKADSLKIRNSEGEYLAVIVFSLGEKRAEEILPADKEIKKEKASVLAGKFSVGSKKIVRTYAKKDEVSQKIIDSDSITYTGQASDGAGTTVFFLDRNFGNIIRVPLKEKMTEGDGDVCEKSGENGFTVRLNGKLYGVKK